MNECNTDLWRGISCALALVAPFWIAVGIGIYWFCFR